MNNSINVSLIGVGFMGRGIARNLALKGLKSSASNNHNNDDNSNNSSPPLSRLSLFDSNPSQISSLHTAISADLPSCEQHKMVVLKHPTEAIKQKGIIALSLPSETVCEQVLFDQSEGLVTSFARSQHSLAAGKRFLVDHGTYSKEFVLYCDERIRKSLSSDYHATLSYIDAPVSGGPQGAWNGTLSIMLGGDTASVQEVLPVLRLYAAKCEHFGSIGKANLIWRGSIFIN